VGHEASPCTEPHIIKETKLKIRGKKGNSFRGEWNLNHRGFLLAKKKEFKRGQQCIYGGNNK